MTCLGLLRWRDEKPYKNRRKSPPAPILGSQIRRGEGRRRVGFFSGSPELGRGGRSSHHAAARNPWIVSQRGPKNRLDPGRPYAFLWEEEVGADGRMVPTATMFLTNRECPYRCLMCDLWKNTLDARVPSGAIAAQIRYALATSASRAADQTLQRRQFL